LPSYTLTLAYNPFKYYLETRKTLKQAEVTGNGEWHEAIRFLPAAAI